jgi:hypothetical protein
MCKIKIYKILSLIVLILGINYNAFAFFVEKFSLSKDVADCCKSMYEIYSKICLKHPKLDIETLPPLAESFESFTYDYCLPVVKKDLLQNLCRQTYKSKKIINFITFKRNVCIAKISTPFLGKEIRPQLIKIKKSKILNTRHGQIKIVPIKEHDVTDYYLIYENKELARLAEYEFTGGFEDFAYKVDDIYIYCLYQELRYGSWNHLIFDTSKSLYYILTDSPIVKITKENDKIYFYFIGPELGKFNILTYQDGILYSIGEFLKVVKLK